MNINRDFMFGRLRIGPRRWGNSWKGDSPLGKERRTMWKRFGGGWHWCLGVRVGGRTVLLELIWGLVSFTWEKRTAGIGVEE